MTFKCFNDSKRLLDWSQFSDMLEGKKISTMSSRSWKKSFDNSIVIPVKMKRCIECNDKTICTTCTNQVSENRGFEANFNLIKQNASNQFGHTLPFDKF